MLTQVAVMRTPLFVVPHPSQQHAGLHQTVDQPLQEVKRALPGLFFLYFRLFNTVDGEYMNKISPLTGFEPQTSGIGSDRSTN